MEAPLQILVLGMHRSGTSVVTQLLAAAGAHVGSNDDLMAAMPDNPQGYWERLDIAKINQDILNACGVDWFSATGDDLATMSPATRNRIAAAIRQVVHSMNFHRPWVTKDPRLSLTVPLWSPLLEAPFFVVCHRHPGEVAYSLRNRDGLPLDTGAALWDVYNVEALRHTRGRPRAFVRYSDLIEQPVATVGALLEAIAREYPSSELSLDARAVQDIVSPALRRSNDHREGFDAVMTDFRSRLWSCFGGDTDGPHESLTIPDASLDAIRNHAATQAMIDALRAACDQLDIDDVDLPIATHQMAARVTEAEGAVGDLRTELDSCKAALREAEGFESENRRLKDQTTSMRREVDAQQQRIIAIEADADRLRGAVEHHRQEESRLRDHAASLAAIAAGLEGNLSATKAIAETIEQESSQAMQCLQAIEQDGRQAEKRLVEHVNSIVHSAVSSLPIDTILEQLDMLRDESDTQHSAVLDTALDLTSLLTLTIDASKQRQNAIADTLVSLHRQINDNDATARRRLAEFERLINRQARQLNVYRQWHRHFQESLFFRLREAISGGLSDRRPSGIDDGS
jgi:predicted nuclease with TOPRIM domain